MSQQLLGSKINYFYNLSQQRRLSKKRSENKDQVQDAKWKVWSQGRDEAKAAAVKSFANSFSCGFFFLIFFPVPFSAHVH